MTIAASPGQLVIEPDQQFIITNNGDEALRLRWDSRTYVIEPSDHKVVPFDVVRVYYGDPRSVGKVEQKYDEQREIGGRKNPNAYIAARNAEVDRLAVLYGLYAGREAELPTHPKIKDVVITTIDRIEVFCPAVDPEGLFTYAYREANDNVQDTATLLAVMQRKMEQQQHLIDELAGRLSSDTPDDDEDVGIDAPRFPE
jgi:hypothetical protein